MTPEQMAELLTGLHTAADLVDSIDNRDLQRRNGWDLTGWRYQLVPWGVSFRYQDAHGGPPSEIVAMTGLDGMLVLVQSEGSAFAPAPAARGRFA